MTNAEFTTELQLLLKAKGKLIPTKAFCDKFIKRLPKSKDIPEEFLGRDSEDYQSWGYALYGYFEDGESDIYDIRIFQWIDIYEAMETKNTNKYLKAVEELVEIYGFHTE